LEPLILPKAKEDKNEALDTFLSLFTLHSACICHFGPCQPSISSVLHLHIAPISLETIARVSGLFAVRASFNDLQKKKSCQFQLHTAAPSNSCPAIVLSKSAISTLFRKVSAPGLLGAAAGIEVSNQCRNITTIRKAFQVGRATLGFRKKP
jgi:hypothetical protein